MKKRTYSLAVSEVKLLICLGALWGLAEATLGWAMHFLHLPAKGIVMSSIGLGFILYGIRRTGRPLAPMVIAPVAACIKLSNLLFPGQFTLGSVMNPVISILLVGALSTVVAVSLFEMAERRKKSLIPLLQPAVRMTWGVPVVLVLLAVAINFMCV